MTKVGLNARRVWILVVAMAMLAVSRRVSADEISAMSIACSNDHVYTWFANLTVASGTSSNLGAYLPPHPYVLPAGKTPSDIVGIGIAGNDHVYVWYRDGSASSGTSTALSQYRAPYRYVLPPGKTTSDIAGIDIACSNDHVYAWYKDGTVSSGTSDDLRRYREPYRYSLPPGKTAADIIEIGIAGNDHVYAWYRDHHVSSGTSEDLDKYRPPYPFVLGTAPCRITAGEPQLNPAAHVIFAVVNRGPSCDTNTSMKISLKRDVSFWFDPTLTWKTVGVTNGDTSVQYKCGGTTTGQNVYVEVESGGHTLQSHRVAIQYCN
jgi:hypothetical protein